MLTGIRTRITHAPFGRLSDGAAITQYTLANTNGLVARIIDLGGIVTGLHVPDREGRLADVVLGFDTLDPYLGDQHLHGGAPGVDKRKWQATVEGDSLHLSSPDTLDATISYTLTDDNELVMRSHMGAEHLTPIQLTRPGYFNLAGVDKLEEGILGHVLSIDADSFVPIDAAANPIGVLSPVTGTPFDFRMPRPIGERIAQPDKQLRHGQGYDHHFVLNRRQDSSLLRAAHVVDPDSGRVLELFTGEPGLGFHSGNFLDGSLSGKGRRYAHRSGFCLAPQHVPGMNPRQGQVVRSESRWRFSVQA